MTKKIKLILILISAFAIQIIGQEQAEIKAVFEKHSKQNGVVYVQLSHDVLSQESNLSLYRSMMMKDVSEQQEAEILKPLLTNKGSWKIITETNKNGTLESGTYNVGKDKTEKLNTYLLVKNKNQKITILYIEGSFAPQRLDEELKKLKRLFIYVNNEKVKIY